MPFLTALDLYLSTASATSLVTIASLGIVLFGSALWGAGSLADHITVVRGGR